jgi:hypothetical protein
MNCEHSDNAFDRKRDATVFKVGDLVRVHEPWWPFRWGMVIEVVPVLKLDSRRCHREENASHDPAQTRPPDHLRRMRAPRL